MNWFWPFARQAEDRPSDSDRKRRRLPPLDLHGAFLRRVDLSKTDLKHGNFAGTDFTGANLSGANLKDANLEGTILKGADLRGAKNLTREQLAKAIIDETTRLPDDLDDELRLPGGAASGSGRDA